MDPDANLTELLELAATVTKSVDDDESDSIDLAIENAERAVRMAELVEALDGWITKGGFLPKRWRVNG